MPKKKKEAKKISGKTQVRHLPLSKIKKLDSLWGKLGLIGHSFSDMWWIFNLKFILKFYKQELGEDKKRISDKKSLKNLIKELEKIIENKKEEKEAKWKKNRKIYYL